MRKGAQFMGNTNKTIFEIKKRINNYYDHSHVFGLEVKNRRFLKIY